MKKQFTVLAFVLFIASPVLAGGNYRSNPESKFDAAKKDSCKSSKDGSCVSCGVAKALGFVIKLPFRLVSATAVGLFELVEDQDLHGFKMGYNAI